MKHLLGIDNGGTGSKAGLFQEDGRLVASAVRKAPAAAPHPGWAERDMEALWGATAEAIREVVERARVQPDAIACTGHGNGLYLVDERGRPVRNGISSTDTRALEQVEAWRADGTAARVLPRTAQSLWPGQPNALLGWLAEHEPETLRRARWVLMCKDYIRYRLTGEVRAELSDMSGTSLMNVAAGRYDDTILEAFGLLACKSMLPELTATASLCGRVTAEAGAATGLREGIPVAGGMFDIDACGLASGMVDESVVAMVAGTWGNTLFLGRRPVIDPELFMSSCYSVPGWYLMLEGSPTSAGNLEWVLRELEIPDYQAANALAASVAARAGDPMFLPFLYGSNAGPRAKAGWVGLDSGHTRAHLVRAVYEGVVFAQKTHFERVLRFRGRPGVIRLSGGAANSPVWAAIFADALETPIEAPAGSELGALGAAIAAAVAVGLYAGYEEAVRAMTGVSRRYEPEGARSALLAARFERYRAVLAALDSYWRS